MMKLRKLPWLAVALNCGVAIAQDSGGPNSPFHLRDPQLWGTPSHVVEPTYPQEAIARRQSAVVEVEGVVLGSGALADITYRPESPASAAFVAALQEVVPKWQFFTPVGNDCMPARERVTARVSFEFVGDAPKIFVTRVKPERSTPPPAKFVAGYDLTPSFPRSMALRGWDGRVYSRVEIDPAGRVVDINAVAYSRYTKKPIELAEFEKPVEFALGSWRYAPAPAGTKSSRFACIDVDYKLRG
jgi:TonB family protein